MAYLDEDELMNPTMYPDKPIFRLVETEQEEDDEDVPVCNRELPERI